MGIGRWKGSVAGSGLYPGVLCSCKLKIGTQRALFCREMTRYWCTGSSKSTGYGRKSYNAGISTGFPHRNGVTKV